MSEQIVLVTGASSGIGKGTALYLAEKGACRGLTLFARRKDALEEVAKEIHDKYPSVKTLVVVGDATKPEDNKRAVDETVSAFGGVHGAFINAGVFRGGQPLHEISDEDMDTVINTNIKGVIYMMRYIIPAVKKTVGDEGPTGSIVVNSSCAAVATIAPKSIGSSIYGASKAFVNSIVEAAAIENAPRIRVNSVMPGLVQTEILPVDGETWKKAGVSLQPLWGRPAVAAEIASVVRYLLSDEASFISGSHFKADGLWSLSGGSFPSI